VSYADQTKGKTAFQCVELAARHLWVTEGWPGIVTNGQQVVQQYAGQSTSGAAIVGGDPVVAIVLSGTMDMASAAQMLLTRFGSPDALAWFNGQISMLADGSATQVSNQFAAFRLELEPNRHLSKNGFTLSIAR
jgi:hypothetical protein